MRQANFDFNIIDQCVVIVDLGPWDIHPTVTNDIEHVIEVVDQQLQLFSGKRVSEFPVIYKDSDGEYTGVYTEGNEFDRFVHLVSVS